MNLLDKLKSLGRVSQQVDHLQEAPFLQVLDLSVRYDNLPALDEVSFELRPGEQVAVVGPNGAGKSTLFKVIAGVIAPSAGRVRMAGHEPGGHICIAYLPQRSAVEWTFPVTVRDVVMMGRVGKIGLLRRPRRLDWDYVQTCLDLVGIADLANRQINELSGGQQQRMFIAQALAQEAELLMMDEPLNGLDLSSQEEVFRILDELRRRGVTVMVATHDLGLAAGRFDRVMLLNHRLLGFGRPADIFTEDQLKSAYGSHLQMVQTEDGILVLEDTCCDG